MNEQSNNYDRAERRRREKEILKPQPTLNLSRGGMPNRKDRRDKNKSWLLEA